MSGLIGEAGSKTGLIGETEIDYEQGTWTPSFASSGGLPAYAINTVVTSATYVKIGKSVTIFWAGTATYNVNAGAAAFQCNGVPFTPTAQFTFPGTLVGLVTVAGAYPERALGLNTSGMMQTNGGNTFPDNSSGGLVARTVYGSATYIVD
tara:strand:+ start:757 stop:1206 length:450 start_codon:yes stop_codon:yes gene_type:complete